MNKVELYINSRIEQKRRQFLAETSGLDQKHDKIWCQFGYPETITPKLLRDAYERHAAANAAVERTINKTWQSYPQITESENAKDKVNTPWEKLVNKIMKKAFPAIVDADRKNLINKFSAVIIRFRDGLEYDQPVNASVLRRLKENAIVGYTPAWQEQLTPIEWDTDVRSDTYGDVLKWQFNEAVMGDNAGGEPITVRDIHHSRIVIFAEGSHDGKYSSGRSLLEAGFNSLIDMQKAQGGAGEGFLKNASRQLHVNYTGENVTVDRLARDMGVDKDKLNDVLNDDIARLNASIDAAMFTFNSDVTPLSVAPGDPGPTWEVAANSWSASVQTPFTILFGQQTGRLASDQDQVDFNMRGTSRRINFSDPVLKAFIDKYMKYGIIEKREDYFIKWDSLLDPSRAQKADIFSKLATANKSAFESNQKPALSIDEMRQAAGYEPVGEDELPEAVAESSPDDKQPPQDDKE